MRSPVLLHMPANSSLPKLVTMGAHGADGVDIVVRGPRFVAERTLSEVVHPVNDIIARVRA